VLADSPLLPRLSLVKAESDTASTIEFQVDRVLHHSARRIRFRLGGESVHWAQLELSLSQKAGVRHVRLNPIARCCIVEFEPGGGLDPLQWLEQLPTRLPSVSAPPLAASNGEEDDESFVPSRIILPVSSLALALLAGPLALPPMAIAGFILISAHLTFRRAWQGLKQDRKINVDFLDALAVTLHSLEGFLLGPAMMITMIEGGEAVRDATQRIAHSANTDLLASLQTDVRLLVDGAEVIVPSTSLRSGDRIVLFPGDQIPVDGRIESGEGSLDVVKLTGESVPRHAAAGDEVLAGFLLLEGSLIVETTAVGEATRVGQITAMIESAPVYDTRVGNVAAQVANRFVLPTLALAGVSLLLSAGNIAQAASLLMFDLGTGLRVSVPTAIMAALTRAGSQGLLIRSGRSLELLVDIDVVVFDKTGTLTQGHPSVVHVEVLDGAHSLAALLQMAATAEQGLNHPVAEAIVRHAETMGLTPRSCDAWDYRIGRGVSATIDGQAVLVGNAKLLREEGIEPASPRVDAELETATPVYLAIEREVVAVIYTADALRPDSEAMVAELHRRGIEAHMLTGDVASVAHAVARRLGLRPDEVHADALPDEKARLVQQLSQQGHKVAFVGDGINDSAALAYADVSISFASGSDLARETADIVLTNDRVSDLIVAQDLARETFALVKQNIGIVGVPNLSALVLGTVLPVSPIAAVLLNNGSALVAAANAMRVLGFKARLLAPAASPQQKPQAMVAEIAASPTATPDPQGLNTQQGLNPEDLNLVALSRRLGIAHQSITARRRRVDFSSWTQQRDPAGYSWTYCDASNTYRRATA
jgi:heavy metal translocating P-type ATPase